MISFKNNIKKSTLSLKIIVVGILISSSLTEPSFAKGVNPRYLDSWQNISRSLTAADEAEDRFIPGEWRLVDNYELLDVPVGESVSIYLKGNPIDNTSGLCDPLVSIYDVNEGSGSVVAFDENSGAGGADDGYVGNTCGNSDEQRYDAFLTVPNWDSDYRIQVSSNVTLVNETDRTLDTSNSGAYTLYVSVGNLPCYVVVGTVLTDGGTCTGAIVIDDTVTSIGVEAFSVNTVLTSVTIPDSVLNIGDNAFFGNTGLESVNIGNSVTSIGIGAFRNNTALRSVDFGDSVESIGAYAFTITGLTTIIIPDSVTSIDQAAFEYNALTSVTFLGNRLLIISQSVFAFNPNLRSITIPNSVISIDDYAFEQSGLESVTIPDSVTSIGNSAFLNNTALTSVIIGNSVTSIGDYAFIGNTALTSVIIPDSVISIGEGAFESNLALTSVRFLGNAPAVGTNGFLDVAPDATAYVGYNATGFDVVAGFWNRLIVVLDSAPAGDSGSDSSPTTKTITPVAVKNADSITNMKNTTYLSKYSMKLKLRENNLFKYSASDSFKYQVFKSSKKSCGMRGNYVMRYENSKTCDLYITRTNAKGISNKYWVKINYNK